MQQIPMAGSTIDQIETLEVAKRKSIVRFTLRMYAMRIMIVSPALFGSKASACKSKLWEELEGRRGGTYRIPSISNPPTIIFAFLFIFKSQITKIGNIPNIKSAIAAKTEYAIVTFATSWAGKHAPLTPENCSQK
jgi:hypothetical protein